MTARPDLPDAAALEQLASENRACTACRLRGGCTQVVVSDGNPAARVLIVGEGPGGDEDRVGRPFVGRGGQLLDKILGAVQLGRDDVYITNIVKCRPPANRTPESDESQTCTALWLEPQLSLLRPQIILTLGNTPTQYMLGTRQGITRLRGVWHPYRQQDGLWQALLMPMFHPAYLLRNDTRVQGGPKSLTWRDIQEVRHVLDGAAPHGYTDAARPTKEQGGLF
ncbi:uracil-DNA glycosylase [Deinococcus sp. KNUC1210]|uniref:uracil-DNA glycosylase n=1 Tax=Deinococcus sp. KNUC1210 TaxID=2917691 RepID=UPI001EF0E290|nr:uracil-DNA glycosylase [Deinococcus sp. KNUC1210]ULH16429.1 uracil-DNA glycosylase [Deinococcus sp. KNUC1210]